MAEAIDPGKLPRRPRGFVKLDSSTPLGRVLDGFRKEWNRRVQEEPFDPFDYKLRSFRKMTTQGETVTESDQKPPFDNCVFVAFDLDTWQMHDVENKLGLSFGHAAGKPQSFKVVGEYHNPDQGEKPPASIPPVATIAENVARMQANEPEPEAEKVEEADEAPES